MRNHQNMLGFHFLHLEIASCECELSVVFHSFSLFLCVTNCLSHQLNHANLIQPWIERTRIEKRRWRRRQRRELIETTNCGCANRIPEIIITPVCADSNIFIEFKDDKITQNYKLTQAIDSVHSCTICCDFCLIKYKIDEFAQKIKKKWRQKRAQRISHATLAGYYASFCLHFGFIIQLIAIFHFS